MTIQLDDQKLMAVLQAQDRQAFADAVTESLLAERPILSREQKRVLAEELRAAGPEEMAPLDYEAARLDHEYMLTRTALVLAQVQAHRAMWQRRRGG